MCLSTLSRLCVYLSQCSHYYWHGDYYYYYYYYTPCGFFHTSFNWWFYSSVSDSKSSQNSMMFLSILADLKSVVDGLDSSFSIQFSLFHFPNLYGPFQMHQLLLVLASHSCSTAFSALWQGLSICLSFRFLLSSLWGLLEQQNTLSSSILSDKLKKVHG